MLARSQANIHGASGLNTYYLILNTIFISQSNEYFWLKLFISEQPN